MELKKQVCSLELAKKLKELGVKFSNYWYWIKCEDGWKLGTSVSPEHYWVGDYEDSIFYDDEDGIYPAYTVAELGEMMKTYNPPWAIYYGHPIGLSCCEWKVWIETKEGLKNVEYRDMSEADARAKMLIYLLENNLITLTNIYV